MNYRSILYLVILVLLLMFSKCFAEELGGHIESNVYNTFNGFEGNTVVHLANGQYWLQTDYKYLYHYAFNPYVIVFKSNNDYFMYVDGTKQTIKVEQLEDCTECRIDGDFNGWDGNTVVTLTNGQVWKQIDGNYSYKYKYSPHALIYRIGKIYKMQIEGLSKTVAVYRIK